MKYTVNVPKTDKQEEAWKQLEQYLGAEGASNFFAGGMSNLNIYRWWSMSFAFAGIEGWPVVALWDDARQTIRDMQS